jgi:hypothetical protein
MEVSGTFVETTPAKIKSVRKNSRFCLGFGFTENMRNRFARSLFINAMATVTPNKQTQRNCKTGPSKKENAAPESSTRFLWECFAVFRGKLRSWSDRGVLVATSVCWGVFTCNQIVTRSYILHEDKVAKTFAKLVLIPLRNLFVSRSRLS